MKTVKSQPAVVEGHLNFFEDVASGGNYGEVTKWVEENLINENPSTEPVRINSFFEAEKEFIRGCIAIGDIDKIKPFLDAVDNEKFDKNNVRYKKLKLNQCKVLAGAIKVAEIFLKKDNAMRESLSGLLKSKQDELKDLSLEAGERNFRDEALSTSINEALKIVQASSSKGKH